MRGGDQQPDVMFSYVSMEDRIPPDHPLRAALAEQSPRFTMMYAKTGRPSIAPEKLLRTQLLQILYTIRSERLLMEQLDYKLLFRWFVGLTMDDGVWDATVFTKNRERLLAGDVAHALLEQVVAEARARHLLSSEHFSVDGTLIEAWASLKSFQRKDAAAAPPPDDPGNPTIDFHGERRSNDTHASTHDRPRGAALQLGGVQLGPDKKPGGAVRMTTRPVRWRSIETPTNRSAGAIPRDAANWMPSSSR